MDGLFHGKPYFLMDDLGGTIILGNTHITSLPVTIPFVTFCPQLGWRFFKNNPSEVWSMSLSDSKARLEPGNGRRVATRGRLGRSKTLVDFSMRRPMGIANKKWFGRCSWCFHFYVHLTNIYMLGFLIYCIWFLHVTFQVSWKPIKLEEHLFNTLRYVCLRIDAIGLIIAYQPHDTTDFPDLSCTFVRENPEISKQFTLVKVDSEVN